ncbi:BTAD domain-containing putative transcriptional regulator [Umezawaea sp. Da 62-37]|uniref:AfsR/SARP family transcriptional regulator n=1 Tax=Umezawaea sp. Da 62-37 TaxID=3075927 RepID=UPI0028F73100|nr:BTAD domain-containing putative transcriptional regulator [Umezawaea sp. Da 62-37]WNV88048.1 BTAD domain-containing putative transcriptional regulator [Umezawaea sp. Da 62-37]
MDIRLLGSVEVVRSGQVVTIAARKPRTLLAVLAVRSGTTVSSSTLVDELWQGSPPPSATNTLQTYISHLRRVLEPERGARVESRVLRLVPDGYRLDIGANHVDVLRFGDAARGGLSLVERGEHAAAATVLRDALSLWRGSPFEDVDESPVLADEAGRLTLLRRRVRAGLAEADLNDGRVEDAVRGFTAVVDEDPFDESACESLMTALCRAGRPSAAVRVYGDLRSVLRDQLGTEPAAPLRDLYESIVREEVPVVRPGAGPPRAVPDDRLESRGGPGDENPRRRSTRQVFALCGAILLLAVVTAWPGPGSTVQQAPSTAAPTEAGVNEYSLEVHPGTAYDLDVLPGEPTDRYVGSAQDDPGWNQLDLYRTMSGPDQISGVDTTRTGLAGAYNVVRLLNREAGTADCPRLPEQGGGKVMLSSLSQGAKVCVRTNQRRWVLLTVEREPAQRLEPIRVLVTVLRL